MLTFNVRSWFRIFILGAFLVFVISSLTYPQAAIASGNGVQCDTKGNCSTHISNPGGGGSGGGAEPVTDPSSGLTPGPAKCADLGGGEVPCSGADGSWSNAHTCYIKIAATQPAAPAGAAGTGAWYDCKSPQTCTTPGNCMFTTITFWSDTPPPGINTLTPAQAAAELVKTFQLRGVDIGLAPDPNIAGSKSYVGVPVWMWVNNPQPLTYGPYSQTATLGGVTITAQANVTSILWNMGDGDTVPCGSVGTTYNPAIGLANSPTCGYKYAKTSKTQPAGRYTITATSQWTVTWTGGGDKGTIPLTRTATSSAQIGEIQSVNVKG